MKTLAPINDPAHWRQRADEARSVANQLDDPEARKTMLDIASAYAELAALIEAKRASKAED